MQYHLFCSSQIITNISVFLLGLYVQLAIFHSVSFNLSHYYLIIYLFVYFAVQRLIYFLYFIITFCIFSVLSYPCIDVNVFKSINVCLSFL